MRNRAIVAFVSALVLASSHSARAQTITTSDLVASTVRVHAADIVASGLVVGDEGWIVTTAFTVSQLVHDHPWGGATVEVLFASGAIARARPIRVDVDHDVALLEVVGGHGAASLALPADTSLLDGAIVHLCEAHDARPCVPTLARVVGRRAGDEAHAPDVSDLVRIEQADVRTTAGAGVIDSSGRLVAMALANESGGPRVSVALPIRYVRACIAEARRARARAAHRTPPTLADLGITAEDGLAGVQVLHVTRGSPADRAGLGGADAPMRVGATGVIPVGTIIVALGPRPTPTLADLEAALARARRGRTFSISIRSGHDPAAPVVVVRISLDD